MQFRENLAGLTDVQQPAPAEQRTVDATYPRKLGRRQFADEARDALAEELTVFALESAPWK